MDKDLNDQTVINFKDYIGLTIEPLKQAVVSLGLGLARLENNQTPPSQIDQLKIQVASLSEGLKELERRLDQIERHDSIGQWVFRQLITVIMALIIAYLVSLVRP